MESDTDRETVPQQQLEPGHLVPERRRAYRVGASAQGLIAADTAMHHCEVVNLSLSGARLRWRSRPAGRPRSMVVKIGDLQPLRGDMVWSAGRLCGIRFLESEETVREVLCNQLPVACLKPLLH